MCIRDRRKRTAQNIGTGRDKMESSLKNLTPMGRRGWLRIFFKHLKCLLNCDIHKLAKLNFEIKLTTEELGKVLTYIRYKNSLSHYDLSIFIYLLNEYDCK